MHCEIERLVASGYLAGNAEPLKCTKCESTDLVDTNGFEEGYVIHLVRYCSECKTKLGEWDYGSWGW